MVIRGGGLIDSAETTVNVGCAGRGECDAGRNCQASALELSRWASLITQVAGDTHNLGGESCPRGHLVHSDRLILALCCRSSAATPSLTKGMLGQGGVVASRVMSNPSKYTVTTFQATHHPSTIFCSSKDLDLHACVGPPTWSVACTEDRRPGLGNGCWTRAPAASCEPRRLLAAPTPAPATAAMVNTVLCTCRT